MRILAGIIATLVIALILYIFYFLQKNDTLLDDGATVEDCIYNKTKNVTTEIAKGIAVRKCRKKFKDIAQRNHYLAILKIEKLHYQPLCVINLENFRNENKDYYRQAKLIDVAEDLFTRSGSEESGVSFEQFAIDNSLVDQLANEARSVGIK